MSSKVMACFVCLFVFGVLLLFCRLYRCNLVICTIPCMSVYTLFSVLFLFYFNNSKSCIFHSSLILFYSVWFLWSIFLLCAFLHIYTHTVTISASFRYSQERALPRPVHFRAEMCKLCKICNICHHFEYQSDLTWGRDLYLLHSFLVNY